MIEGISGAVRPYARCQGEQIDLDAVYKPTRVMSAPAEPPVVTGAISVVPSATTFLTDGLLNGDIQFK